MLDLLPDSSITATGTAIDLYCGTGNLSLPLAQLYGTVIGIEGLPELVKGAEENARINNITNAEFAVADLSCSAGLTISIFILQKKVRVYYVPKVQDVDSKLRGCNKISAHDLSSSYYFDASLGVSNDIDVTVVIGIDSMDKSESFGSILLMRFHKLRPSFTKKNTDGCTKTFFTTLRNELSNGGLERRRVGGSSGKITYSRDVKLLLATPNSTPRCSSGAVWLRDKSDLKWHVFYLGTKDGEQKYTYYTTPRQGGSFNMPPELYSTYPFLMDFASTKPLAANILIALQESLKHKANIPNVNVCPATNSPFSEILGLIIFFIKS